MNNNHNSNIAGTSSMGHDNTMAHSNGYASDGWTSISPYNQSPYSNSPLTEYGSFGAYVSHGIASESMTRMPPPPPHQAHQIIQPAPAMAHPQLPMLNTAWPSQLTNPSPTGSYSAPPPPMSQASAGPSIELPRLLGPHEKSRKTLSTEQKRAMCHFHEDNPGTRQADIGARFGVERSTVSKVLRHKDQFLKREPESDPSSSSAATASTAAAAAAAAAKRSAKGKHPDFDRTLNNYVRRQQQRGFDITDSDIMEQARLFAHASGSQDGLLSSLTSIWLQKFKQKHGIGSGKLVRRASDTNILDNARVPARLSPLVTDSKRNRKSPKALTPLLPNGQLSPLSRSRSDEELHGDSLDFEFNYKQHGSHSTTSLTGELRDNAGSSFSETISPTGHFTFSPDPNVGAFPIDQSLQLRSNGHGFHRERRSNTFPSLNLEGLNQTSRTEPITPRHPPNTEPSSALQSPTTETAAPLFSINTTIGSPQTLHRSSSNSSINRLAVTPVTNSAVSSTPADTSPVSPSHDDARRAAVTLLSYIQSTTSAGQLHFDQTEYMAVMQLTKKLQIHPPHQMHHRPSIGGLLRIPEGEVEMPTLIETAMESA